MTGDSNCSPMSSPSSQKGRSQPSRRSPHPDKLRSNPQPHPHPHHPLTLPRRELAAQRPNYACEGLIQSPLNGKKGKICKSFDNHLPSQKSLAGRRHPRRPTAVGVRGDHHSLSPPRFISLYPFVPSFLFFSLLVRFRSSPSLQSFFFSISSPFSEFILSISFLLSDVPQLLKMKPWSKL